MAAHLSRTAIALTQVPTPDQRSHIMATLDVVFRQELGIYVSTEISRMACHPNINVALTKAGRVPWSYEFTIYKMGLEIKGIFSPLWEPTQVTGKRGGVKVEHFLVDWLVTVYTVSSSWTDFTPSDMAWASGSLLRHIESDRLKGFEFELTTEKERDAQGREISVPRYRIKKVFQFQLGHLLKADSEEPDPDLQNIDHWIWSLGSRADSFVVDDLIDVSPEVQLLLPSKFMLQHRTQRVTYKDTNGKDAEENVDFTLVWMKDNLTTWRNKLSTPCPYAHQGGFHDMNTTLTEAILFWNNKVLGNRELCAGCTNEFTCMAREYRGGGSKLEYPLQLLEPPLAQ
jgi:hypothetical protein